ncbi:nucleolar, Nop52 [Cordyceps militaris]|uniref:Nucleolar, Nop52 n=1 Tax=Cordyceps militaris TaxID=73501 RepID=A0A2H4SS03_CORMI|nr:nucleolar, Nop52 [Cordyceps militaris]
MTARAGQEAASMPFIKNLASSGPSPLPAPPLPSPLTLSPRADRKLRTSSLEALTAFLAGRRSLSDGDARKLWTGLYYGLWMTDRPKPQQALAADLAGLVLALRAPCVGPWLRAFWHVLGAQWTSIEALRLDKFLLLVRRVWAAMVRYAARAESAAVVLAVCREYVFDGDGGDAGLGVLPLGLKLHVLDIWVDELEREGVLAEEKNKAWVREMGDLVEALRRNGTRVVRERAKESYEDERLPWAARPMEEDEEGEEDEDEDEEGWGGIDD